ncbi:MAG: hypothetical protein CVU46_12390 [Chloroflexi bacterium HGW-Chloroflexi-8]|jgi:hypothetical protein|nr:MAG: hypothetical protein CVU46_12390 [Chloroflexi bacterium HGW-Chloroflexi-8]
MDETRIVAKFEKNAQEMICVGVNQWQEKWRCFIRVYYPGTEKSEDWLPTKKGISLDLVHFPELQSAIYDLGTDLETEREVAVINKGAAQEIRINLSSFKKIKLINIRTYVKIDSEWNPTQKGVSLKPDLFPALCDGIEKLAKMIPELI